MSDPSSLPHFQQSSEGYCLPACARMVLASIGLNLTEAEIGTILGTRSFGTPTFAITRLDQLGVQVTYREWSVQELVSKLNELIPVIVFVRTAFLDYWTTDVAHAIVVIDAIENTRFIIHDPACQLVQFRSLGTA